MRAPATNPATGTLHVAPQFQHIFRELGIDADAMFTHEQVKPWRRLPDRENCTLDAVHADGTSVRLHVKRYAAARGTTPAEREVAGHQHLIRAEIPTAELVAWAVLRDRRSVVIWRDLAGFEDAEKLVQRGHVSFDQLLEPTADLAAALHGANLHHRDLYLCHFFACVRADRVELRLIDTARVRPLPTLTRRRWIVKDLAQFCYSTVALGVTEEQRQRWLARYAGAARVGSVDSLRRAVERKVSRIARHDRALKRKQPTRNVSIPSENG